MKKLVLVIAALALTSCGEAVSTETQTVKRKFDRQVDLGKIGLHDIHRFCDNGRAIYLAARYNSSSMTIVENAKECQ